MNNCAPCRNPQKQNQSIQRQDPDCSLVLFKDSFQDRLKVLSCHLPLGPRNTVARLPARTRQEPAKERANQRTGVVVGVAPN